MKKAFVFLCAVAGAAATLAAFDPIPFGNQANASLMDDVAGDGKGGFIDLGGNDLRLLPSGAQEFQGIPFALGKSRTSSEKACIVLGGSALPNLPKHAKLTLPQTKEAKRLYILHAAANLPSERNAIVGKLTVEYADGSVWRKNIRKRRDVGDWTVPTSFSNAARAWTIYNNSTQVSLFLTSFDLQPKHVKEIRFHSGDATWMIEGVTLGSKRNYRPISPDLSITRKYDAPAAFAKPLPVYPAGAKPKNVVFVLGDGMGQGALTLASLYVHGAANALNIDRMPFAGICATYSASADVTDSAASATAFSCGKKTTNSYLGMDSDRRPLKSVATAAKEKGMSVGLLTDDGFTGATPSAYYAHVPSRADNLGICKFAGQCGFEILLGYGGKQWLLPKDKGGERPDGADILASLTSRGYTFTETLQGFLSSPVDKPVVACLQWGQLDSDPSFKQLADAAFARLSRNPNGFFALIESCDPDHGSHANKPEQTISGVVKADWAVTAAVDYSLANNGDTLVIVTGDHETGSCWAVRGTNGKTTVKYDATSHTAAPVPVHAFGPGAELFEGVMENTDLAKNIAKVLGLSLE